MSSWESDQGLIVTLSLNVSFVHMRANLEMARQLGLVDWTVDTWTIITGVDAQYVMGVRRTIITVTSTPVYYHTESFQSTSASINVKGDSGTWANMVDVDIPLGVELFGHELRTGGYYRWTGLYGGLRNGLHESNLNEIHGRVAGRSVPMWYSVSELTRLR